MGNGDSGESCALGAEILPDFVFDQVFRSIEGLSDGQGFLQILVFLELVFEIEIPNELFPSVFMILFILTILD